MKTLFFFLLMITQSVFALPLGMKVLKGTAYIEHEEDYDRIIASDGAILDFQSFDIGLEEKVIIRQHSSTAKVLILVQQDTSSKIFGSLESNGFLCFINSNGFFFDQKSKILAQSFIVSTMQLLNIDFRNKFHFITKNCDAQIITAGEIWTKNLALFLSPTVIHEGLIYVTKGDVIIDSSKKATINFENNLFVNCVVEEELEQATIKNMGRIYTYAGKTEMRMKAVQNGLVMIAPKSEIGASQVIIDSDGQQIISGFIGAPFIHLFSDYVTLEGGILYGSSRIKSEILVGGDYENRSLRQAFFVFVNYHATIYADALGLGDGGRVCIFSQGTTTINGNIFARGGSLGGNGGIIQTIGQTQLNLEHSIINTWAPRCSEGLWLRD